MTKVMSCTCRNDEQDKIHGKGQRVHNSCGANKNPGYRCTSCNAVKPK
jgi:hypothetical protein